MINNLMKERHPCGWVIAQKIGLFCSKNELGIQDQLESCAPRSAFNQGHSFFLKSPD
jgi:hypothetical protein